MEARSKFNDYQKLICKDNHIRAVIIGWCSYTALKQVE